MDPALILFAIQSLIQIGSAASEAYEQAVRDEDVKMPALPKPIVTVDERLQEYFNPGDGIYKTMTGPGGALERTWLAANKSFFKDTVAIATLLRAADTIDINEQADGKMPAAYIFGGQGTKILLEQWSDRDAPLDAWQSIALTLAQVGLGFVGLHPNVAGLGGNGDKLLQALCANLQQLLPDPKKTKRVNFVRSVAAGILHAGLKTVAADSNLIVDSKAAATLISKMAQPLVDLYDKAASPAEEITWEAIRDTVLPQMIQAGLTVLSQNQKQILGKEFDTNSGLGALTQAFVQGVATVPFTKIGTPEAWIPVYQSLLKTIANQPGLLIKGSSDSDQFFSSLLGKVAGKLAETPVPYNGTAAIELGALVLDQLATRLPAAGGIKWDAVATAAIAQVVDGLKDGGPTVSTLMPDTLGAVVKAILTQVADTPAMIAGRGSTVEVQAIVASVAKAMAQDTSALISPAGWQRIASVAAATAAQNPARLFKLNDATPEGQLASNLISQLLTEASKGFVNGRAGGVLLFGETLVSAIEETLTAAAGNAVAAAKNQQQLTTLVTRLNALASDPNEPIGAAEWSWLFRNLVADVLDKGSLAYTDDQLRTMLYKRQVA